MLLPTRQCKGIYSPATVARILRGDVQGVISGLRRMGTAHYLAGKAATDLTRICGYLEKNADRMRYDEYLRRGYPLY